MFTNKHTIARLAGGVAVAASVLALSAPAAFGAHDPWYSYASSLTRQATAPTSSGHDPWYGYALSLTGPQASVPFITDTLAPGGRSAPVQGDRFITDTLAPGGHSAPVQGYQFITDTLAPGGGTIASAPAAGGFDWVDAGIGAAGTAGLLLLLLGSGRVLQQHRRRVVAA